MKKREEDSERRIKSKQNHKSIPLDLIPDILLKLPAKSVARFRCVSKLWLSITTHQDFITSFAAHQSSTRLCLLVSIKSKDKQFFFSLPQHEQPNTSYSHVDSCHVTFPKFDCYTPFTKSVQGLMCFGDSDRIVVWNPTMRQHVTLPKPRVKKPSVKFISSCLGYDPVEDKYKVLCIYKHQDPLVFTLGLEESWRLVTQNSTSHFPKCTMGQIGTCINGHMYYQARIHIAVGVGLEDEETIMSFDVRYEKFNIIKKPADPNIPNFMVNYKGKLACVCSSNSSIKLWVLEDEEKEEWSTRNFLLPFPTYPEIDPIWEVQLELRGVTYDTGEFIFIALRSRPMYVLYYDPKRNRSRRVIYEGFGDKEFAEHNGDVTCNFYCIEWYLNHIESLMSLENVPCKESHLGS